MKKNLKTSFRQTFWTFALIATGLLIVVAGLWGIQHNQGIIDNYFFLAQGIIMIFYGGFLYWNNNRSKWTRLQSRSKHKSAVPKEKSVNLKDIEAMDYDFQRFTFFLKNGERKELYIPDADSPSQKESR